jgi:hypothetical protein
MGSTETRAAIEAELEKVRAEIDRTHSEADSGLVATALQLAGYQVKYWGLRARLYSITEKNDQEAFASREQREWAARMSSLAQQQRVDLFPKILAKLEEQERQARVLAGLH